MYLHQGLVDILVLQKEYFMYKLESSFVNNIIRKNDIGTSRKWLLYKKQPNIITKLHYQWNYEVEYLMEESNWHYIIGPTSFTIDVMDCAATISCFEIFNTCIDLGIKPRYKTLNLSAKSCSIYREENITIFKICIEYGNIPDEYTIEIATFCFNPYIIKICIDYCCIPTEATYEEALEHKDMEIMKLCLDNGIYNDLASYNIIRLAIETENVEIVKLTLEYGPVPDEETLEIAIDTDIIEIVQLCIDYGAICDEETLEIAIDNENEEIIKLIKEHM